MENLASPTTSILFTFSYLMTIRCLSCCTSLHASSYSVINNCDESYIIGLIAPAHPDEKIDYEVVFDRRFVRLSICAPSIPLFAYAVTNEPIDTKFCLTRLPWPVDMLRHLCEGYDATTHIYKYRYKIKRTLFSCVYYYGPRCCCSQTFIYRNGCTPAIWSWLAWKYKLELENFWRRIIKKTFNAILIGYVWQFLYAHQHGRV